MKKITLLFALMAYSLGYAQISLPMDFEGGSPVTADFNAFDGAGAEVLANVAPQTTGNTSATVMKLIRDGGQPWAGAAVNVDVALDFTTDNYIVLDVWTEAPIGTKIMFKMEEAGNAANNSGEKDVFTTKTGEWETLVYNMTGVQSTLNSLVFIPDNGNLGDGTAQSTFFYDNVYQTATPPASCSDGIQNQGETGIDCGGPCAPCQAAEPILPYSFDDAVTADWEGFDGAGFEVVSVEAPQNVGNGSTQIGKLIRNGGQTWAGAAIVSPTLFDFSTETHVIASIWTEAPIGTTITLKFENSGNAGDNSGDINVVTTKTGEWEALSWTVPGAGARRDITTWDKLVLIPDNGNLGDGSGTSTFFFDDIYQASAPPTLGVDDFNVTDFTTYPNPTSDKWNIKTTGQDITSVQVFDMLGKRVINLTPNRNSVELDASNLRAGLYFARLSSETGTKSIKLIKQ